MSTVPNSVYSEALSQAVKDATSPEAIKAALIAEAQQQQLTADEQAAADAAKIAADEKAAADAATVAAPNVPFTRVETIGGRDFTFEAESELELERMINNALKVASVFQSDPPATVVDPVKEADAQAAREKAAVEQAAARTEMELQFKRGEITAQEYIEKSGAVKDYLEKQGVPLDELKATIEQGRSKTFEQSWADATEEFLHSATGADWPGGEKNKEILGLKLSALNLIDTENKVEAIAKAWSSMKENSMFFPAEAAPAPPAAPVPAAAVPAAPVIPAAPVAPVAAPKAASTSSSLFGRSSGTNAPVTTAQPVAEQIPIPADARPEEILAAWKEQMVKGGQNPDEAFKTTFSHRR